MSDQNQHEKAVVYPHSPETYRSKLSWEQLNQLLMPIDRNRVRQANGQSHVEAYDIRAHLDRIFGIANWDGEVIGMELIGERWSTRTPKSGGQPYTAVTVAYRAGYRLRVRATDGTLLATYTEWAMGDAINQSEVNWGNAHDQAMKTAESQAMKRCATNLGDQFGLSLYRKGSLDPVVGWTMNQTHNPHAETPAQQVPTDRTVPDVTAETDPDAPMADADEVWGQPTGRDPGQGMPQVDLRPDRGEDPEVERGRQDNAAEASQTRPHPNSRERPGPAEPGSATRLTGGPNEPATPPGEETWAPDGAEHRDGYRRMTSKGQPKSTDEWRAAWRLYSHQGAPAFRYFISICMHPRSNCPDFIKAKLQDALTELEGN